MTLNQLKYIIAISKENSLNDAAKKLFISQPSLSAAVHPRAEFPLPQKELNFWVMPGPWWSNTTY